MKTIDSFSSKEIRNQLELVAGLELPDLELRMLQYYTRRGISREPLQDTAAALGISGGLASTIRRRLADRGFLQLEKIPHSRSSIVRVTDLSAGLAALPAPPGPPDRKRPELPPEMWDAWKEWTGQELEPAQELFLRELLADFTQIYTRAVEGK